MLLITLFLSLLTLSDVGCRCSFSAVVFCVLFVSAGVMGGGIIGGKQSKPHSSPYMVSVQLNEKHYCGGFLIEEDFVLTAAHCYYLSNRLISHSKNKMEVVVGAFNLSKAEGSQQRIQVRDYIMHPKYKSFREAGDWRNLSVDIMLLKLKSKANLNRFVSVLKLPENYTPSNKVNCTIAGWGMRKPNSMASDVLYETLTLHVLPVCECKQIWDMYFDPECMMCTKTSKTNTFCQGDSGGPLICNRKPQGIAIYTYPNECNNPDFPGVYIKISPFMPWIIKTINKNGVKSHL